MNYQHIQYGGVIFWTIIIVMILAIVFTLINAVFLEFSLVMVATCLLILALFYSLRTEINKEHIYWGFGIQLFQGRIPLTEIESCEIVDLQVWKVGGMKWFPEASIYSLGGKKGVAIQLKNKKRKIIIGTDDAANFYQQIQLRREFVL